MATWSSTLRRIPTGASELGSTQPSTPGTPATPSNPEPEGETTDGDEHVTLSRAATPTGAYGANGAIGATASVASVANAHLLRTQLSRSVARSLARITPHALRRYQWPPSPTAEWSAAQPLPISPSSLLPGPHSHLTL